MALHCYPVIMLCGFCKDFLKDFWCWYRLSSCIPNQQLKKSPLPWGSATWQEYSKLPYVFSLTMLSSLVGSFLCCSCDKISMLTNLAYVQSSPNHSIRHLDLFIFSLFHLSSSKIMFCLFNIVLKYLDQLHFLPVSTTYIWQLWLCVLRKMLDQKINIFLGTYHYLLHLSR